jgi:hypothetical protein
MKRRDQTNKSCTEELNHSMKKSDEKCHLCYTYSQKWIQAQLQHEPLVPIA